MNGKQREQYLTYKTSLQIHDIKIMNTLRSAACLCVCAYVLHAPVCTVCMHLCVPAYVYGCVYVCVQQSDLINSKHPLIFANFSSKQIRCSSSPVQLQIYTAQKAESSQWKQRVDFVSHARYIFSVFSGTFCRHPPPIMFNWHSKRDFCGEQCQAELLIGWPLEVPAKKPC